MTNQGIVELYQPRHTLIGRDGITMIPHFLERLSADRVLVVTDKGLMKTGIAGKVTAVLDDAKINYVIYDGVEPNPSVRIINEAFAFYKAVVALLMLPRQFPSSLPTAVGSRTTTATTSPRNTALPSSPSTLPQVPALSVPVLMLLRTKKPRASSSWSTPTACPTWPSTTPCLWWVCLLP